MAATKSSGSDTEIVLPPIVTQPPAKKKRSLAGHPDPDAEVIALSPRSLLATNRFVCEVCNKGFQRDQNLQLHRRGHNLPWTLKHKSNQQVRKKVYICPEKTCIYHDPSRALGDLTGIKKHYSRKHGEKKWKCEKCSKKYAVQSDWKAHQKVCGTREYHCDCGTLFSRKDSFITHRAFCDALAENNVKGSMDTEEDSQLPTTSTENNTGLNGTSVSTAMDFTSSPGSQITGDGNTVSDASKSIVKPEKESDITPLNDGNPLSLKRSSGSVETSTEGNTLSSKPGSALAGTQSESNSVPSHSNSAVEAVKTEGNPSLSKSTAGDVRTNSEGNQSSSKLTSGGIKNNSNVTVGVTRNNNEGNTLPMNWTPGGIRNKSDERASSPKWNPGIRNNSDGNTSPPKWPPGVIRNNNDVNASVPKWTSGMIRNNNDGNASPSKRTSGAIRTNSDGNVSPSKWTPGGSRINSDGNASPSNWTPGVVRNSSDGDSSPSKWTSGVIKNNSDGNASPKWIPGVIRNNTEGNASPRWSPGVVRNNTEGHVSPRWNPGVIRNNNEGNASPSKWPPGMIVSSRDGNASSTMGTSGAAGTNSDTLNKAPALSLSLGTGHGPGPPSVVPEGRTSSDTNQSFAMQSPRTSGFSGFLTSESPNTSTITLPPTGGAMEKLASILSSTKSYPRHDYDNGNMSSNRTGFMYGPMKPPVSSVSVPSMMGEFGHMRPSSGSASMSATALLLKAAEMGATSTNLSLFQKFGGRGGESSSGGTQAHASWSGCGSTYSTSSSTYMKTSQTEDLNRTHDYNVAYTNTLENRSALPVESRYYNSNSHGMTYPFETVTQGMNSGVMMDRERSSAYNNVSAVENGIISRLNTQRKEHDGDRQMLDFLGVEGHNGVVQGPNTGIDRILSHKDLARINSFGGRIEVGKNPSLPA